MCSGTGAHSGDVLQARWPSPLKEKGIIMKALRLVCVPLWVGANQPEAADGPISCYAQIAEGAGPLVAEWVPVPDEPPLDPDADDYALRHGLTIIRHVARETARRVARAAALGSLPIVVGGDHSLAIGSVAGLRRAYPRRRLGVLWVDAHPDLNTPQTTPSHHAHGMPLAALLGEGHPVLASACGPGPALQPEQAVLVGIRAIDPGEADFLARHPELLAITAQDIRKRGILWALELLRHRLAQWDAVHLSLDLDVVDPGEAPGVTTPVSGGLAANEVLSLVQEVAASGKLVGVDLVELLPSRDKDGRTARLAARLVMEIAASTSAPATRDARTA